MASTVAELGLRCFPWEVQVLVSRMTAQSSHLDRSGVVICRAVHLFSTWIMVPSLYIVQGSFYSAVFFLYLVFSCSPSQ